MNRKQLLTLLVLVVAVGAASWYVYKKQNEARRSGNVTLGQKLLPNLPINDIARISIKQGTNQVNLEKKGDLWRVRERGDYPAAFNEISSFVLKARDLKALETEKVGPSQLARLSLVPGQGTNQPVVVELFGANDKQLETLTLGKKHMKKSTRPSPMGDMDAGWADGRYVMVGAKSENVALVSEAFENIEPNPERWLDKEFLRVEKVKTVAVSFPEQTNSWKLVRETENGQWKLADAKSGEDLDQSKASGVGNPLSSPYFNDVLVGKQPAELGLDKPTQLTIETFDNFAYDVKVGAKTNDHYAMTLAVSAQLPKERTPGKDEKPEDKAKLDKEFQESQKKLQEKLDKEKKFQGWVYQVSSWTLDSILKNRSELMAEKKEPASAGSTNAPAGASAEPGEPAEPADTAPNPAALPSTQ